MKKISSIFFILGVLTALSIGSPEMFFVSAIGLIFSQALKQRTGYAFLSIVPAVMRDPATMDEIPPMTRAEKALFDFLRRKSNAVTYEAILSGAISFDPISYVIRYNITNLAGKTKIVGRNTLYAIGVTNFPNGATLPQYYNFCFDRIAVRYATTNSANASPAAIAGYSSVGSSMDPGLRNGELIVSSNGNTIVETPVIDFVSQAAVTGGGSREYDGGILEKPRFFLENLLIEVELNFSTQIPNTANTTFCAEVVFSGVQARLKY